MKYEKDINNLKEWFLNDFGGKEVDFKDYLDYCRWRGMLTYDEKFYDRVIFNKANALKLYKEFQSPVKRTAKLLGLTYKELAEQIGYTENGLKNAIAKNQITEQLKKTLELLLENKELKNKLEIQNTKFNELKNYFKRFFLDF